MISICLAMNFPLLPGQINLTIEGTVVNNSVTGSWSGVNIQRNVPTSFIYRNNSITSVNGSGYMLQAGDEGESDTNNNLDGEVISGNKFIWNGSNMNSITHGIFTGHNKNALIKYNYLDRVPMGIIRKSTNGMTNNSGGVAYNIVKNPVATGGVVKGMNNVNYFNNTFYSNISGTWRGLIDIYSNTDVTPSPASTGTKIKNNIFYTVNQIYNIAILDEACLPGFESDYNVFYCESGTPVFNYLGSSKTFAQWQALGFDKHSRVKNPEFINTVDLAPAIRLDYGTDLGTTWETGLSISAAWAPGTAPGTTNQNGNWQVGAKIYGSEIVPVTPSMVEMTIYPNPTHQIINILLDNGTQDPGLSTWFIRIFDITGKNLLERKIDTVSTNLQFPLNLKPGMYAVILFEDEMAVATQNMIVY